MIFQNMTDRPECSRSPVPLIYVSRTTNGARSTAHVRYRSSCERNTCSGSHASYSSENAQISRGSRVPRTYTCNERFIRSTLGNSKFEGENKFVSLNISSYQKILKSMFLFLNNFYIKEIKKKCFLTFLLTCYYF
jgi:hypothetical protein